MAKTVYEAAGIAFVAGDRVLMLKRPDGVWGLPFGKVEPGETTLDAAIRETFEEIGRVITDPLTFLYRNVIGDTTSTCYMAKCEPFNPVLNEEHTEFIWAPINNIPTPTFPAIQAALNGETVAMDYADTAREYDHNGWMEVKNNPISKVGVYPYLGKNIRGAPDPAKLYNVYRPAEELSDPECIESFKLLPWVNDHAMLGDGELLTKPEDKGIEGVIGERVFFDVADETLKANLKVFTSQHSQTIDAGKKELSVGYRCKYEYAPGVYKGIAYEYVQRKIRGNHLASVDDGRMGPDVSVMDGFSLTIDSREFEKMSTKKKVVKESKVSRLAAQLISFAQDADEEAAPAGELDAFKSLVEQVTPLMAQLAELQCVMNGSATPDPVDGEVPTVDDSGKVQEGKPTSGMDEDDDDKKDDKDKKGDKAMDASDIQRAITAGINKAVAAAMAKMQPAMDAADVMRDMSASKALAEELSYHIGTFDHSAMTEQAVAAYGAEKLGLPATKGTEVVAVRAFLHGRHRPKAPLLKTEIGQDGSDKSAEESFAAKFA